ncbi:MAG: hypothetical protein R2941_12035 [Desulfobacterales bacterium]
MSDVSPPDQSCSRLRYHGNFPFPHSEKGVSLSGFRATILKTKWNWSRMYRNILEQAIRLTRQMATEADGKT